MNVYFYKSFKKRVNSTLQPAGTDAYDTHDCKLKQDCSEHDPVLLLNSNKFDYTYVYIPDWSKYYFVTDVISRANSLVEYHLTEDVLATYKTAIGATSAHIIYSSGSTGYAKDIIDPRIQVFGGRTVKLHDEDDGQAVFGSGCYLLSVFNDTWDASNHPNGITGLSCTYVLNGKALGRFKKWLTQPDILGDLNDYLYGDPLEGIFNLIWVPYDIPTDTTLGYVYNEQYKRIVVGQRDSLLPPHGTTFDTDERVQILNGWQIMEQNHIFTLTGPDSDPLHYNDFRRFEPYTQGLLYLPGVGPVDLSMTDILDTSHIRVQVLIELMTGNIKYIVRNGNDNILQMCDCNVAARCPLGRVTNDASGVMTGITQTVGGLAALAAGIATGGGGMALAGAAGVAISGVANTALSASRHGTSISGGFGGRTVAAEKKVRFYEYYVDTEDPSNASYIAVKGRPHHGVRLISTQEQFVQCDNASVSCDASFTEREEINRFLNSGFYYE